MKESIESILKSCTSAKQVCEVGVLQSLWSGYGSIVRYELEGAAQETVIVKHVSPPGAGSHPRGWNTDHSHARKLRSYAVETAWYRDYANHCSEKCRVPQCLGIKAAGDEVVMVLEDLDSNGFPLRKSKISEADMHACLEWLAHFHATFLGNSAGGLWERGTYWHLDTRPDELEVLGQEDPSLHAAASWIDAKLKGARFQTLVHGDAKLANFCFQVGGGKVAAVDFQYVGGGCGVQDVAYFIGSCLDEQACEVAAEPLLEIYFIALREAVYKLDPACDLDALESEWRALYPFAWTDFHRFLKGWSPDHWKIHGYSERLAREVIALKQEMP